MLESLLLFAQEQQQPPPGGGGGLFDNMMFPMLLIFLLFMYLMVFLPERRRRREQQAMMSSLKVKDRVELFGAIMGVVSNISDKEDEVTVRLEEGKMRVRRSAITRILAGEDQPAAATQEAIK